MVVSRMLLVLAAGCAAVVLTPAAATAAGGGGASLCSFATGPTGAYDLGASIRSNQPFNGNNNPGFAGPGVSPFCKP